jgi:transcriptional regulator with XRE-family HTH domain
VPPRDRSTAFLRAFGEAVREARERIGLSQEELGVVGQRGAGGTYTGEHAPWGNRVLEHVCRLAVVLEVLWSGIDASAVTAESIERAIRLVRYFDAHYWAIFGAGPTTADPVAAFAAERIVEDSDGKLLQTGLYEEFRAFCERRAMSASIDSQTFWERLKARLGLHGQPTGRPRHFLAPSSAAGGRS